MGSADVLIDAINADFPGHVRGTRPIHAPGIAVTGWFEPSPVAHLYTDAAHFAGGRVPVTVRFSNGTGLPYEPDSEPVVRGMAVRFHLDATTDRQGVTHPADHHDMVCVSLAVFFTKTVDRFLEFLHAAAPVPVPTKSAWRKVLEQVTLLAPQSPPRRGEAGMKAFANRCPASRLAIVSAASTFVPESYATELYHAVHAFGLLKGTVTRWARFAWEPVAGVRPVAAGIEGDFLHAELRERLELGPAEFVLRVHLAEQGDDTTDPTRRWPKNLRKVVVMGHLWLDTVVTDQVAGGELLEFNPMKLVPGIEASQDEILRGRPDVYARSAFRRKQELAGPAAD